MYDDLCLKVPEKNCYGIPQFEKLPQLLVEMNCYALQRARPARSIIKVRHAMGLTDHDAEMKSAFQHMVNVCQMLLPNDMDFKVGRYMNWNTIRVFEAMCTEEDVAIAGNASASKTHPLGGWGALDWMCMPTITSTFIASTGLEASEDRLWGSAIDLYTKAIKQAKVMLGPKAQLGKLVLYKHAIIYGNIADKDESREYKNAIKAVAFPPGEEGKRAIANMRGRKNERVVLLLDELAEMDAGVLDVKTNFASNDQLICGAAANPDNRASNPHKELCQPDHPLEWESVNKEMDSWKTRTGVCLFLSGERSPNFQAPEGEPPPFPYLLTRDKVAKMLRDSYGNKNTIKFWRNAIGFWPSTDIELNVISRQAIGQSGLNVEPRWRGAQKVVCGFDPAFTSGGDRCAASFIKSGRDETNRLVGFFLGHKEYQAEVGKVFEESIAEQLVRDCIKTGVLPHDFGMDISGDGGKMLRQIIIEWQKTDPNGSQVYPISSMGPPTDKIVSEQDKRKACDAYDRLVTEYWFNVLSAFHSKALYGVDLKEHKDLVDELCARLYYHKGKKVTIEKKDEMKKRIKKSPDIADSLVMALQMLRRTGVSFSGSTDDEEQTEREIREFESRVIYKKSEPDEEEMFSYAGSSVDEDGFA